MTTPTNTTTTPSLPPSISEKIRPLEREFATYCRELPRLLEEGEAGRYALIKGEEVISIWDTQRDAIQAGRERYGADEPLGIVKIDIRDPERIKHLLSRQEKAQCQT